MPKRRAAWSSWNYLGRSTEIKAAASKGHSAEVKPVFVTYWLNKVNRLFPEEMFFSRRIFLTLAGLHSFPQLSSADIFRVRASSQDPQINKIFNTRGYLLAKRRINQRGSRRKKRKGFFIRKTPPAFLTTDCPLLCSLTQEQNAFMTELNSSSKPVDLLHVVK